MKYMQVNVEYDYQTIRGPASESVGLIVNPELKGSDSLHKKAERFIRSKFCSKFSGRGFKGVFIKECYLVCCSKQPTFDVE